VDGRPGLPHDGRVSDSQKPESPKQRSWDERYAASELVWGAEPNRFLAEAFAGVRPRGRALDLACGEGRNAIWLAAQGWETTGVDFSHVAIERARALAERRGVAVRFIEADVTRWQPERGHFALVVIAYLQLPDDAMAQALEHAVAALAPGGELFAIGHARSNLAEGAGGPQDPGVLWDPEALAAELRRRGLRVDEAEQVLRSVEDAPRPAIDARIRARARGEAA
jgi:SAM-dependent methyltransferase